MKAFLARLPAVLFWGFHFMLKFVLVLGISFGGRPSKAGALLALYALFAVSEAVKCWQTFAPPRQIGASLICTETLFLLLEAFLLYRVSFDALPWSLAGTSLFPREELVKAAIGLIPPALAVILVYQAALLFLLYRYRSR